MHVFKEKRYLSLIFLIFLWNALLRIYFWPDQFNFNFGYYEALENHLLEYVLNTGMKPPFMYLFQGFLAKAFGSELVFTKNLMLISVLILDFISFSMLFYILILTKISFLKSSIFILLYSFYQIPIEFWKLGMHYDSFSLFFNTLFIFSITIFINKQNTLNGIMMSITGSLLIFYGSIFFIVVPITIIFCVLFTMLNKFKYIYFFKICCLLLFIPMITSTVICTKNYLYRGVFAPSTFGGVALMLTTMRTVDRNIIEGNKIVKNSSAPHWYKWCWEKADKFMLKEYKKDYVAVVNNKVFGQCMKFVNLSNKSLFKSVNEAHVMHINNHDLWPFDMTELKEYLSLSNSSVPLKAVNKDIDIMKNKKYLIHGTTPELSFHWTDLYGKEGGKIFWEDFSNHPLRYFKTFVKLFKEFTIDGSQFPLILSKLNERSKYFNNKFSNNNFTQSLRFIGNILQIVILVVILSYCFLFFKLLKYIKSNKYKKMNLDNIRTLIFGLPALLITVLYSTIVGEENSRYLIYALPYFLISFIYIKPENIFNKLSSKCTSKND